MPPKKRKRKPKAPKRITKKFNGVTYDAVGRVSIEKLGKGPANKLKNKTLKQYRDAGLKARSTKLGKAGHVIWVKRPTAKKKRKKRKKAKKKR